MLDLGKHSVLGVDIAAVDMERAVTRIIDAAREQQFLGVSALAVHGVMTGVLDPVHRARLNTLDLNLHDGQPVRWALNWLYHCGLRSRVSGPDLVPEVCAAAAAAGLPIYLYGSTDAVLDRLERALRAAFPSLLIAGRRQSAFRKLDGAEQRSIAAQIAASGARIVFVGLGCPRQEVWVYEHRDLLPMPCLAVGAAFDFIAGTSARAPEWMRKRGLEWLFRLLQEPRRLWRRYLLLNPAYLAMLGWQLVTRRVPAARAVTITPEYFG